ncbi:MAG: division/cell wall cluster transcriptional repressor MraZ [Anaerolineae bacterium]
MFLGEFEYNLDDKGRLTIPAKFREQMTGGIVVTRGLDGCLWAFPMREWEPLAERIAALPLTSPAARNFSRHMFALATDAVPDRQGRIIIPQNLREAASIENRAIIIGMMTRIEIWHPDRWKQIQREVEDNSEALASQLAELGI